MAPLPSSSSPSSVGVRSGPVVAVASGSGASQPSLSPSASSAPLRIKLTKRSRTEEGAVKRQDSSGSEASQQQLPAYDEVTAQAGPSRLHGLTNGASHSSTTPVRPLMDSANDSFASTTTSSPWSSPAPVKRRKRQHINDVLPKLVQNLIKRDAYGFFLLPVDEREVPGYKSVIREPMDLGTMEGRVKQNHYGTMDAFRSDLLLLTKNAKLFNPPTSIYHTQAQKLEEYGLRSMEKLEEKGIKQHGDESSPEPDGDDHPLTLNESPNSMVADTTGDGPSSSRRISIKLKKRNSISGKSGKQTSRPLISSSLGRPPLQAESSRMSQDSSDEDDEDGEEVDDEDDGDGDNEGQRVDAESSRQIKSEDVDDDQSIEGTEDDSGEEEEGGGPRSSRAQSSFRASETPAPGNMGHGVAAALRKKIQPPRGRNHPPRNAPTSRDEAGSTSINRTRDASKAAGIPLDFDEAALRVRAEAKNKENTRPTSFLPDGSVDFESLRFVERCDLLAPRGFTADPETGYVPLAFADGLVMPDVGSVHPLHPDAQRFLGQLARPAPYDALRLATNEAPVPREASGSHYEHALPLHHHRVPMSLPSTTAVLSETGPVVNRPAAGSVPASTPLLPHHWPYAQKSQLPDYEPVANPDPLYPPAEEKESTSAPKPKNKDLEHLLAGQSQLNDWTFPHAFYSRVWDGSSDLAIWKDVEAAIIGSGAGVGTGSQAAAGASSGGGFCLFGTDGELRPYERWEWSRLELLRTSIMWEENAAVCKAAGITGPDRISERAMLEKLDAIDNAGSRSNGMEETGLRASAIPAHEKASQADSSGRFLQNNVWGGFEGELWASSMERFVKGAVEGVVSDDDEESEDKVQSHGPKYHPRRETGANGSNTIAAGVGDIKPRTNPVTPAQQQVTTSKADSLSSDTAEARLFDASIRNTVLDRDLYTWVRDEVVVPVSKRRFASVISRTGELVEEIEFAERKKRKISEANSDDDSDAAADVVDQDLWSRVQELLASHSAEAPVDDDPQANLNKVNISYLISHMPLIWSRLRLLRSLMDRPLHLIDPDDLPPFMIDDQRKRLEWLETPPMPTKAQLNRIKDPKRRPLRLDDRHWTGSKVASALEQYARILLSMNDEIRSQQTTVSDDEPAKAQESDGTVDEGVSNESKVIIEQLRLALLALARFAPTTSILL